MGEDADGRGRSHMGAASVRQCVASTRCARFLTFPRFATDAPRVGATMDWLLQQARRALAEADAPQSPRAHL